MNNPNTTSQGRRHAKYELEAMVRSSLRLKAVRIPRPDQHLTLLRVAVARHIHPFRLAYGGGCILEGELRTRGDTTTVGIKKNKHNFYARYSEVIYT